MATRNEESTARTLALASSDTASVGVDSACKTRYARLQQAIALGTQHQHMTTAAAYFWVAETHSTPRTSSAVRIETQAWTAAAVPLST